LLISPKKFVAHNSFRARRADISDIVPMDIAVLAIGDNMSRSARCG
jgi:hypothetical protein